jgi:histidinol-phosphatase (PHP family)
MKIDYHIHSQFSADSNINMREAIIKAIQRGYTEIAFTEHFDLIPEEIEIYGVPSYKNYSLAIDAVRKEFPNISILKGVELGEYHLCHNLVDQIMKNDPPDLTIGSVHVLPGVINISIPLKEQMNDEVIRLYYISNLGLVKYGNFDILGHLGVHKRYLEIEPDESFMNDTVEEIFYTIIEKEIALEVNLSGLTKPLKSLIPTPAYLTLYRKMGGELLTLGSDSHNIDSFDRSFEYSVKLLTEFGFKHFHRKIKGKWLPIPFDKF